MPGSGSSAYPDVHARWQKDKYFVDAAGEHGELSWIVIYDPAEAPGTHMPWDAVAAAISYSSIDRGDALFSGSTAICQNIVGDHHEPEKTASAFLVVATFNTLLIPDQPINPLDRPAEIEWFFVVGTEEAVKEDDGAGTGSSGGGPKAVLNSADEPFDPSIEKDVSRPAVRITQNLSDDDFSPELGVEYADAVNSDEITIDGETVAAGKAKVCNISAIKTSENVPGLGQIVYWRRTIEIHFRRDGWRKKPLDQGFREYVDTDDGPKKYNIVDDKQQAVSRPALLDGEGHALTDTEADPVYLEFQVYPEISYSDLDLP